MLTSDNSKKLNQTTLDIPRNNRQYTKTHNKKTGLPKNVENIIMKKMKNAKFKNSQVMAHNGSQAEIKLTEE